MSNYLVIPCNEWLAIAEQYPAEMEVVMEMMIDADLEFCG